MVYGVSFHFIDTQRGANDAEFVCETRRYGVSFILYEASFMVYGVSFHFIDTQRGANEAAFACETRRYGVLFRVLDTQRRVKMIHVVYTFAHFKKVQLA